MWYPHSIIFTLLSISIWKILSKYFLKTALCALVTEYDLEWYGLVPGCSYIHAGLVFQLPSVLSKRKL